MSSGRKPGEGLHHFPLFGAPILYGSDVVPHFDGGGNIGVSNKQGIDSLCAAATEEFVVLIIADWVGMAKYRKRSAWMLLTKSDEILQFDADVAGVFVWIWGRVNSNEGRSKCESN